MHKREDVYAVMKTPLFKSTFKYANLLYGIGNYAYALKLLECRADRNENLISWAFPWEGSKEGHAYWYNISCLQDKEEIHIPV